LNQEPEYWQTACELLVRADSVLGRLITTHRQDVLRGSGDALQTLVNAIVGQQISVSAAESIWGRLRTLIPNLEPEALLTVEEEDLRKAGLSRRKIEYIRGVARAFLKEELGEERFASLSDGEIKKRLCRLRGIGPWTADMFLIFYLNRPDVLPIEDLGLVNAAARLYGWDGEATPDERKRALRKHAERWRPWRSVATWYIWRDLDAEPVIY